MQMNTRNTLLGAIALAFATTVPMAIAQQSADTSGKATAGTQANTPVPPARGAQGGMPHGGMAHGGMAMSDDAHYMSTWSAMDTNKDGRVSREEYNTYHGSRYDRYDVARRGYLDRDEMRRLYLEREMSKNDGHPQGTPLNATTPKKP